jgi:hypothetical protein
MITEINICFHGQMNSYSKSRGEIKYCRIKRVEKRIQGLVSSQIYPVQVQQKT